jgi:hypothetical protein
MIISIGTNQESANALVRILRKKQRKMPASAAPVAPSRENVINLMDALRRSRWDALVEAPGLRVRASHEKCFAGANALVTGTGGQDRDVACAEPDC